MRQALLRIARLAFASVIVVEAAFAQSGGPPPGGGSGSDMDFLKEATTTRIADPKLDGGGVDVRYFLNPSGTTYDVTITARALSYRRHNRWSFFVAHRNCSCA